MTRRRRPRTAQERVVGVLGTVAPGSLGGRIRNTRPATVLQPNTGGPPTGSSFDPNLEPVVIGENAAAGSGTPDDPTAGQVDAKYAVAVGSNATASGGWYGVAVGDSTLAGGASAIAIGDSAQAVATSDVAVGHTATTSGGGASVAVGSASGAAQQAVAVGDTARATARYAVAIGEGPTASSPHAIVIGQESTAAGYYSVAVGTFVYAAGQDSIAMGRSSEVDEDDGIAIGRHSWVKTGHTQSAAFGYNAQTSKPYQIMLGAAVGTSGTPYFVEIAGSGLVLKDTATGTRYLVQITSGALVLNTAP